MGNASQLFKDDEDERVGYAGDDELQHLRDMTGIDPREESAMEERAKAGASDDDKAAQASEPQTKMGKLSKARSSLKSRASTLLKKKWVIGVGVGGGGLAGIIILLLLLLSAFKIPHLMQNITGYQFARVFQQQAKENKRIIAAKTAVDSADDATYDKIKGKYAATGKVKDTFSKLDKYRPNKVIQNLYADDTMKFNYTGRRMTSISINGKTIETPKATFTERLMPFNKFFRDTKTAQQFSTELNVALRANDVGLIVRGQVAKKIRDQLGISLVAWKVGEFKGMKSGEARLAFERDASKRVLTKPDEASIKAESTKNGVAAVDEARAAELADDTKLTAGIKDGGVLPGVKDAINRAVKSNAFQTGLGWANGAYAIATPICIVYEGSMDSSGSSVDSQRAAQTKMYNLYSSVSDQEKDGNKSDIAGVRAASDKVGNIQSTNAMRRANGQDYDTSGIQGADTGAGGTFTMFNALFGGNNSLASIANVVSDKACPVLTDTKLAVVVAGINFGGIIFSGGSLEAGELAASKASTEATTKVVTKIVEKEVASTVAKKTTSGQIKSKVSTILGDSIKSGAKIAAITVLAKMEVASKAGEFNSGLEQNEDAVNMIDSGANANSNEISRRQQFGRPLNLTETAAADAQSSSYVASQNRSKSTYQRYLAISNSSSLVTQFGTALSSITPKSVANTLLSPTKIFSSVMSNFGRNAEARDLNKTNYGNIQWGWSAEEQKLADEDQYQLLENQKVLDDNSASVDTFSGQDMYGKCFSSDTTIGTLLQAGDIQRDDQGNVLNTGDIKSCSPQNLGPHNPQYGDLVFRWRLAMADNQGLDDLTNEQEITEDAANSVNTGNGASFTIASFNVLGSSHAAWQPRAPKSVQTILGNNVDVSGMQEFTTVQRNYFMAHLSDYDNFPKGNSVHHSVENSIIWKKSKFKLVASGYQPGVVYFCHGSLGAPWVKLITLPDPTDPVNNPGGQQIYVLNTHDPANAGPNVCSGSAAKDRYFNALKHVEIVKKFKAEGIPVFFVGDFNSAYENRSGNGSVPGGDTSKLTYCVLTNGGLMNDAYDVKTGRKVKCPNSVDRKNPLTAHMGGQIDHVYMSDGITVTSYTNKPSGQNGSDHPTLIVGVKIPSTGGTGAVTGGWQWPLSQNDWNGPFGTNVWGSCSQKCRHAGIDLSGTGGDKVLAAHSGTVKSVDYVTYAGGTCKWQVLVQASGTPYYYAYQHMGKVTVKKGQEVKAGDPMGSVDTIGPTGGCGHGAHLHFSVERGAKVSAYADGVACDINQAACAKKMSSMPPLCFLDKGGRNYGGTVSKDQIKGTPYCDAVVGKVASS